MNRTITILVIFGLWFPFATVEALHDGDHPHHYHQSREVLFPDIPGYHTMSTDLHIHTVFSDGSVWPNIRVEEALRDGLDAIAITDHLEYQPHQDDIPHPDRNRSHAIADEQVDEEDLIVISGSEITRSMPPGHGNAIFLEDANDLLVDDPVDAYRAADAQGAFSFWNHPGWVQQADDGIPPLSEMHRELIDNGLLHGIEVVNHHTYSREALQIALDHNLTILGTSDIHGLVDWDYDVHDGGHRPVTLVFSEDYTIDGLKEALFEGRTVVWKDDLLIGKEPWLVPLIEESLTVTSSSYRNDTAVLELEIENKTGQKFILENRSEYSLHHHTDVVTLEPYASITFNIKTLERLDNIRFPLKVLNAVTAPDTNPEIVFERAVD